MFYTLTSYGCIIFLFLLTLLKNILKKWAKTVSKTWKMIKISCLSQSFLSWECVRETALLNVSHKKPRFTATYERKALIESNVFQNVFHQSPDLTKFSGWLLHRKQIKVNLVTLFDIQHEDISLLFGILCLLKLPNTCATCFVVALGFEQLNLLHISSMLHGENNCFIKIYWDQKLSKNCAYYS